MKTALWSLTIALVALAAPARADAPGFVPVADAGQRAALQAYAAAGLAAWGYTGDLRVAWAAIPDTVNVAFAAQLDRAATGYDCAIAITPAYWGEPFTPWRELTIAHELGHCLGFDHPDPPDPNSIMSHLAGGVTDSDRARLRERYAGGMPYRTPLAMIAR